MTVETNGHVQLAGEHPPGFAVRVIAGDDQLRIEAGDELWGEWKIRDLRINALNDGFAIRAAGEDFILRAADDVGLAEEFDLAAASPRLARKMAARHNPEERPLTVELAPVSSNVAALAFALAGAMVLAGGTFLESASSQAGAATGGGRYWPGFVIGGIVMVAAGYVMSSGRRWAYVLALAVMAALIVGFALMMAVAEDNAAFVLAYGFIAAGVVVGVAVLSSSSLRPSGG